VSKGSKRRPEDRKKIDENWDRIFGKKEKKNGRTKEVPLRSK